MTVEEYADACEALGYSIGGDGESIDEVSSILDAIEDALAELKGWNPPEEIQEFHEVRVRSIELALDALKDLGFIELLQDLEKAAAEEDEAKVVLELMSKMAELEDEVAELEDETNRTEEELSPATREILADADCL